MRVLFIGDVVGPGAVARLRQDLPRLRADLALDAIVVNADNAAVTGPCPRNGYGLTMRALDGLCEAGVDIVTLGNHAWDAADSEAVLAQPRVLRAANAPVASAGKGWDTVAPAGRPLTLVSLSSGSRPGYEDPVEVWQRIPRSGLTIVNYHGDSVTEKSEFAFQVAGSCAAVLGSGSHEATVDLHVLAGSTAFVADVGMTGPSGGIQGMRAEDAIGHIAAHRAGRSCEGLPAFRLADGPLTLGAVVVEAEGGVPPSVSRVTW